VRLQAPAPKAERTRRRPGRPHRPAHGAAGTKTSRQRSSTPKQVSKGKTAHPETASSEPAVSRSPAPTVRMVAYAQKLAKAKNVALPPGYDRDFHACRRFLDQHLNWNGPRP